MSNILLNVIVGDLYKIDRFIHSLVFNVNFSRISAISWRNCIRWCPFNNTPVSGSNSFDSVMINVLDSRAEDNEFHPDPAKLGP